MITQNSCSWSHARLACEIEGRDRRFFFPQTSKIQIATFALEYYLQHQIIEPYTVINEPGFTPRRVFPNNKPSEYHS